MATSFQKFRIWKENVLEELYRKYQGKTIKDDYGKNSKEFIDFANDLRGEKTMIRVLFVCHGTTLAKFWKTLILQYIFEPVGMFY